VGQTRLAAHGPNRSTTFAEVNAKPIKGPEGPPAVRRKSLRMMRRGETWQLQGFWEKRSA